MYYNRTISGIPGDHCGGRHATRGFIGFYVVAGIPVMMLPSNRVVFAAIELPNVRDTCPEWCGGPERLPVTIPESRLWLPYGMYSPDQANAMANPPEPTKNRDY
ncbi:MAG: hypothetical protein OXC84_07835 [Gammaproteobacteria bacterium]|nr:hypothetical protein [Gammaproteobacteria bacterium]